MRLDLLDGIPVMLRENAVVLQSRLLYGAFRSAAPPHNWPSVEHFCQHFVSLPFDDRAADSSATSRADLAAPGQLIGLNPTFVTPGAK